MYILYSEKLKKYYVGSCVNPERRLYEYNIGHSKFTRLGVPWSLAYSEEYTQVEGARRRELYIKRMKSKNISRIFDQKR